MDVLSNLLFGGNANVVVYSRLMEDFTEAMVRRSLEETLKKFEGADYDTDTLRAIQEAITGDLTED